LQSEVVERLRKPAAEEHPPHAVDEHASGERVVLADEPLREVKPVGAAARHVNLAEKRGTAGSTIGPLSSSQLPRGRNADRARALSSLGGEHLWRHGDEVVLGTLDLGELRRAWA